MPKLGKFPKERSDQIAWLGQYHETLTKRALYTMHAKNSDYCSEGNVFHNLEMVEHIGLVDTEKGILIRMNDKMARLISLTKPGAVAQVQDESLEDTIVDMINYSILLAAKIRSRKDS